MLALAHEEVVHGKAPSSAKCPATTGEVANRALSLPTCGAFPARTPLQGHRVGQWAEWNHEASLDWHLTEFKNHNGLQRLTGDLNALYRGTPALHKTDCDPAGFEWIDCNDGDQSTLSFIRRTADGKQVMAIVCNFTPVPRPNFRVGVPVSGHWREVLNRCAILAAAARATWADTVPSRRTASPSRY